MNAWNRNEPVAVVGGGLAGLAAAAYLARGGRAVTVYERAQSLGGRAATHEEAGHFFNLGPHALYLGGEAAPVLAELGVRYTGNPPVVDGAGAILRGRLETLPGAAGSLFKTRILTLGGKFDTARILAALPRMDVSRARGLTQGEWLARGVKRPDVRDLLRALFRLTTYANSDAQSAEAALRQLRTAFAGGVLYVDGGWRTLVEGLRESAERAGAKIVAGTRVASIECDDAVRAVRLASGERIPASGAVLAVPPETAAALAPESAALRDFAARAVPVRAATLDLGLSRLPEPKRRFALGIDAPLYFSVHSAYAKVAPEAAATIHVAKYLDPHASTDAKAVERELEGVMDLVQPGWREAVTARRFLPNLSVSGALLTPGLARPGVSGAGVRGLALAGDWADGEAMLADASLGSAKRAAEAILKGG